MLTRYSRLFDTASDPAAVDPGAGGGGAAAAVVTPPPVVSFRDSLVAPDGSFTPDWLAKIPAELQGDAALSRTFTSLPELIKGFAATKRMVGEKLAPPAADATPEAIAKWRGIVGAPADVEGYKEVLAKPADAKAWDEGLAKTAAEWALANHVPPAALKGLVEKFNGLSVENATRAAEQQQAEGKALFDKEAAALKTAWGDKHDANIVIAKRAAATFGIPADHYSLTDSTVVKALHMAGVAIGESRLHQGGSVALDNAPGMQAQLIQTDKANPHYAAYHDAKHPNHAAVRSMVLNLRTQK